MSLHSRPLFAHDHDESTSQEHKTLSANDGRTRFTRQLHTTVGVDLVRVERMVMLISRYGECFLKKLFTDQEIDYCYQRGAGAAMSYAARFAAKEATFKALPIKTQVIRWLDIEVINDQKLSPAIELHGPLSEISKSGGLEKLSVSITHDSDYAIAVVAASFNNKPAQKKVNLWELCIKPPL